MTEDELNRLDAEVGTRNLDALLAVIAHRGWVYALRNHAVRPGRCVAEVFADDAGYQVIVDDPYKGPWIAMARAFLRACDARDAVVERDG